MNRILRNVGAVLAGLIVGSMVNMALVTIGPKVFPWPEGMNPSDPKGLAAAADLLEPRHFIFPFLAHALGTLVGAALAHLVGTGRRAVLSGMVGGLFLAGGIAAALMIPAPAWFVVLDLVGAYLPMAWLGAQVARRLRPTVASV